MPELQFKSITSDPDWTQITVDGPFNLGVMEVQFKTLKNNKPNAYKNYLAIWEGSGNPWTDKKLRCEAIKCDPDMNKGDWAFTYKLKYQQEYVLGYCVSNDGMDDSAKSGERGKKEGQEGKGKERKGEEEGEEGEEIVMM